MRFVIIAAPRTGSSHLSSLLYRHPAICCHGELFNPNRVHFRSAAHKGDSEGKQRLERELRELRSTDSSAFLERIYTLDDGRAHVGFKIFSNHHPKMLKMLLMNEAIAKIVLYRANVLARFASMLAAKSSKTWGPAPERPLVEFDAEQFTENMNEYVSYFKRVLKLLNTSGQRYFFIRSDELNNELRIAQLLSFLDADLSVSEIPSGKSRERGLSAIVERFSNPEEVTRFLEEHRLMHWTYEGDFSFEAT
jgi:hypothetical protein